MVDLENKIKNNLESEKLYDLENNLDTTDNINQKQEYNFINPLESEHPSIDFSETNNIETTDDSNSEVANCLALTVKKDYSLSIVKNVFIKTLKNTWRIALSIFTLNILKFFL